MIQAGQMPIYINLNKIEISYKFKFKYFEIENGIRII